MTTYVTYKCTECKRIKDVVRNDFVARTDECTITKGCLGRLYQIGTTDRWQATSPAPGLTDWFPRGSRLVPTETTVADTIIDISTASNGSISVALMLEDSVALANDELSLNFLQQNSALINTTKYTFRPLNSVLVISGRDANGLILRFDQSAIDNDQISVMLNGVLKVKGIEPDQISLAPNLVVFNSPLNAGDIVLVTVYNKPPVSRVSVPIKANYSTLQTGDNAWNNIRWVDAYDKSTGDLISNSGKKLWVYSSGPLLELSVSTGLQLVSVSNSQGTLFAVQDGTLSNLRVLLARPPYSNLDRRLDVFVGGDKLSVNFPIQVTNSHLTVSSSVIESCNPAMQLITSASLTASYITQNNISITAGVSSDTQVQPIFSNFMIGPV